MKRGLKDILNVPDGTTEVVTTYSPMKRGLKAKYPIITI